jgi:hypothetical protein
VLTILVTGGCSFSECTSPWVDTWPEHLESAIDPAQAFHEGLSSQGNGMISREIIWRVSQLLDFSDKLIVGIMWSGPDRHELLLPKKQLSPDTINQQPSSYNWIKNSYADWLILHHSANTDFSKDYYTKINNRWYSQVLTIEHILRVQWFLKLHNIRYFMTTFTDQVLGKTICNGPDIKYLYEQIDFDQFLPVSGEYEWCRDHSSLEFPIKGDRHPSTAQHKLFTEQVILPFLKEKEYI